MASRPPEIDDDDDFSEIYKEYTGPPGANASNAQDKAKASKRSHSDEEEEARDPNAVPTDFTSREAKVWEAKSKATERNWKKRKEEEMICKICGDAGHFTQGCPSTLGANRKSQDFFERVPARDKHVRALFSEKVIGRIEKDVGCKIRMDEKFIIVSGKDRLVMAKGVDAVHKVINDESNQKGSSSSQKSKSRSPERSPASSHFQRSEPQRPHSAPRFSSHCQHKFGRQEKAMEDHGRKGLQKSSRVSPPARGNDGARGHPSHSRSPARSHYTGNSHNSYDGHNQSMGGYRSDGWDIERQVSNVQSGYKFEYPTFPQTLEELELEFKREAVDLTRSRDKEEDEENCKHRENLMEMRESYMKKLALLRERHAKEREEFFQLDSRKLQQQAHQHMSASGFGSYGLHSYSEYDGSATNPHFGGTSLPMDSRSRYQNPKDNYPSRPHDTYNDFQSQRRDGFGRAYNRY